MKREILTAEKILEKKKIIEKIKSNTIFDSDYLDAQIVIKRLPVEQVIEIMQNDEKSLFKRQCELIYTSCECFRNQELMKEFDIKEPYDIISKIFSNNVVELSKLTETILSLYGFGDLVSDVKK